MENKSNLNKSEKVSQNLKSILDNYSVVIEESEQNNYLKEVIEEVRDDIQTSFLQNMKNIYNPRIDIQQRMVLSDDIDKEEMDFFSRKLLLLDRAGVQLEVKIYLALSLYFLLSGYYLEAIEILVRNLDIIEEFELALNMLGVVLYKYNKKEESLEVFEEIISKNTVEDIIFYNAALLLYMIGDYNKAVSYLEGRDEYLSNRNNFFLCFGDSLYNIGEKERATLYFEKYLYKNPNNQSVLKKLIEIHYEEENYSKTIKFIDVYESNDGNTKSILFKKAVCLYFTGTYNKSMLILANLLGIEKKYLEGKKKDYLFGLFVECFRLGMSDEKVFKVFRHELEAQKWDKNMLNYLISQVKNLKLNEPSSLHFLGVLYKQIGDIEKAKSLFEKVLSINPSNIEAYNWLGLSYYEMGDKKKTIDIYKELLKSNNVDKELSYQVARLYLENNDFHNAREAGFYAYKKGIRNLETLKMIGFILIELNELEEAYEFYVKARKLQPQDLEVQNQLGVIYLLKENFDEAAKIFKQVVKKDPSFSEAHYNLGITYKKILEKESQEHINKFYELSTDEAQKKILVEE